MIAETVATPTPPAPTTPTRGPAIDGSLNAGTRHTAVGPGSGLGSTRGLEHEGRVDEIVAVDQAIVAGIPPDMMAKSLGFMLPAMNIEDRFEMLSGIQAGAPPEGYAGVWALAGSVLTSADHRALGTRLGIA